MSVYAKIGAQNEVVYVLQKVQIVYVQTLVVIDPLAAVSHLVRKNF